MGKLILLMLVGLACLPVRADTVLLMGDSISAGYGLPAGRGWENLLREKLGQMNANYTLANASISGETSAGGSARLDQELALHHPAVVILELGANDGLRGMPPAQLEANLASMIQRCRAAGARVLLLGMRLPPNYGARYYESYAAVYPRLAEKTGSSFVPFLMEEFAADPAWFQADGVHPNETAQPLMFEKVWAKLAALLPGGKP
ncbi:MAG: arylesterase [Methylococcaceae bacterium]|nr:MAG: arylesterase [Methylococcaceae bacterium]